MRHHVNHLPHLLIPLLFLSCAIGPTRFKEEVWVEIRKVDIRLHGKGNSNSHGARPVYENHLDDKVDSDQ